MIINPSSLKRLSMAIHIEPFFYKNLFSYMPFINVSDKALNSGVNGTGANVAIPKDSVKVAAPTLDFFNWSIIESLWITALQKSNYALGMVESFQIDNIDLFKPVETFTYSNFISSAQNNVLKTSGNINIPVILPYNSGNFNSLFLQQVWRLSIYTFVPFFMNTNVYPQNIGGPLFVEDFNISVDQTSYVKINLKFNGGTKITPNLPYDDYTSGDINQLGKDFRVAKNYDCVLAFNIEGKTSATISTSQVYNESSLFKQYFVVQGLNLFSATLNIKNDLELDWTANDGVTKNLSDGLKYLSLKKRKVTGSFKFIASENLENYFNSNSNKQFMLYFGGPFYYPMKNVTVQVFKLTVDANTGSFIHEVSFFALLQPSNYKEYYMQNEFNINQEGLYAPINAQIYVQPQDPVQ